MAVNENVKVVPMVSTVFCKTSFEGIHFYKGAPDEVAYLKHAHRHTFGVQVELQVYDDDREIEFIMLKHSVNRWLNQRCVDGVWPMGGMSCEMVAKDLADAIAHDFGIDFTKARRFSVTIDEDGENGASIGGVVTPVILKHEPEFLEEIDDEDE